MTTIDQKLSLPQEGRSGILYGGEWHDPEQGTTFTVENPSTRQPIQTIGKAGPSDVNLAVQSARAAFKDWKVLPARSRGAHLGRIAERIADQAESLAQLLSAESGNALRTQSRGEVNGAAEVLRYYSGTSAEQKGENLPLGSGMLSYTSREPLGVVGAIIPWNSPVILAAVKIGMALATGNTLVLKPAEDAPLTVTRIAEIANEELPAGVLNVVNGSGEITGAALSAHPDVAKVSFTGSSSVGKAISHAVADRVARATLELGGKSPSIVFPDAAATDEQAESLAGDLVNALRFARQGQSCTAGSRLFLHRSVWDRVLPKLVARTESLVVGDALDEASDVGAVINTERYDEIRAFLQEAQDQGAVFETGAVPPEADDSTGLFPKPVVLTGVTNEWRIAREEVFGPVLVVIPWEDEDDVIEQANDTIYGLAAYIFTHDVATALRVSSLVEAGWIQVNQAGGQIPGMSYGGMKQSGIGSEYSIEGALEAYTVRKSVTIRVS